MGGLDDPAGPLTWKCPFFYASSDIPAESCIEDEEFRNHVASHPTFLSVINAKLCREKGLPLNWDPVRPAGKARQVRSV